MPCTFGITPSFEQILDILIGIIKKSMPSCHCLFRLSFPSSLPRTWKTRFASIGESLLFVLAWVSEAGISLYLAPPILSPTIHCNVNTQFHSFPVLPLLWLVTMMGGVYVVHQDHFCAKIFSRTPFLTSRA